MAEVDEVSEQDGFVEKKPRKPRKTSRFLVMALYPPDETNGSTGGYYIAAEGRSVEGCRNQIKERRIHGNLLIVCVHRTLDVKIQTVETLTGV